VVTKTGRGKVSLFHLLPLPVLSLTAMNPLQGIINLLDGVMLIVKVFILTVIVSMITIIASTLCEGKEALNHEYHFHPGSKALSDITFHTPKGDAVMYFREDASIKSFRERNFYIRYNEYSELTYGKAGTVEFTPDTKKPLTHCLDKTNNINLQIEFLPKEDPDDTEIRYWGILYGNDVDVTYKIKDREVLVNRYIHDSFESLWNVSKAVRKVADHYMMKYSNLTIP
jgi:hypothetical protein